MRQLGWKVAFVTPIGKVTPITRLHQIDEIKKNRLAGYNFFACRSTSIFHEIFESGLKLGLEAF
jgi:hypothetical protein